MLDRAIASYEAADFETALRTFDTAARNADLSVEELLQLFEMRALVHHANGDEAAMRADLLRVIAIRPSYRLGRLAPPLVREAFDEMRSAHAGSGGVELRIEEGKAAGAPVMIARVLGVPDGLVDHVTLQCNIRDDKTKSSTTQGSSTRVELSKPGGHMGCVATARTRQGGVLFSAKVDGGMGISRTGFRVSGQEQQTDASSLNKKKKKWPWIVAASALVVGGGIAAGVLLSRRSDSNDVPAVGGATVSW